LAAEQEPQVLHVTPIPAFEDNYIWLLSRDGVNAAAVVDPGDPDPVLAALADRGLFLEAILVTHHHWDHAGGLDDLRKAFPAAPIYGPADRRIPAVTEPLGDGDRATLESLGVAFLVLAVPGHTATHIAYYGEGALFCGDTLFAAGCGRVFDGTFEQLAHSLQRIARLPQDTRVFCAHEYTLANLGFAKWVEPENEELLRREVLERRRREVGDPTVPSLLGLELATNPFLRTGEATVVAAAQRRAGRQLEGGTEVFRVIRQWKDKEYD
jgi:hydroxyacylglutathione hydrolase